MWGWGPNDNWITSYIPSLFYIKSLFFQPVGESKSIINQQKSCVFS